MPPTAAGQPAAEKKHRKKPRRGGIGGQPIRRPPKPVPADQRPLAERRAAYRAAGGVTDKKFKEQPRRIRTKAVDRLPQLWLNSYEMPMKLELAENDFLGMTAGAELLQFVAPQSTYQVQGRVSADQAGRRLIKDGLMRIKWSAAARHRGNQRDCPFSMLARSIGKLARTDSGKTWVEDNSILSKVRSTHYLLALVPLRPPPPYKVAMHCSAYGWDQYYMKEHCNGKDGEYRGRKSVATTGMTHTWKKITNINTVEERRVIEPTHPQALAPHALALTCCFVCRSCCPPPHSRLQRRSSRRSSSAGRTRSRCRTCTPSCSCRACAPHRATARIPPAARGPPSAARPPHSSPAAHGR